MSLIDLIREHCETEAEAANFSAVASILNGLTRVKRDESPVTLAALAEALDDAAAMARLKEKGIKQVSIAGRLVSAEECQAAWSVYTLETEWVEYLNERINPALASGGKAKLIESLRSVIQIMESKKNDDFANIVSAG
jgi:hypothetical protein